MTGLEKIIKEIHDEAAAEASAVIAKAKSEAEDILATAQADSDALGARNAADAAKTVADIERSRDSALQLQRRQQTLAKKQELLAETLDKALTSLYNLPEAEYFALLEKLAVKAAQPGEGTLLLSDADCKRMPAGFDKTLAAALPKGSTLAISTATRPIDGGFVLSYGGVEENCSFKAMFDARREEFSDLVRDILFA